MQIIINALVGAFFNSFIRGAFIDHFFKQWPKFGNVFLKLKLAKLEEGVITLRFTKPLNASIFALFAYFSTNSYIFAVLFGLAMLIGQAPALFNEDTDKYKALKDWPRWALVVMERAALWILPLIMVSLFYSEPTAHYWVVLIPVMPIAYSLDWTGWKYRWFGAEAIYGMPMWAILALI